MFRQRTSSQKPGDDFLAEFRQQFPGATPVTSSSTAPAIEPIAIADETLISQPETETVRHGSLDHDAFRDEDPTPRASHEPWRFTPSLLDANAFSFNAYPHAAMGYYPPTPGGNNTLFHPQAGDLHTPTMGMGHVLGTPLSMPNSVDGIPSNAGIVDMSGFQPLPSHQLHHFNPFVQVAPPQRTYAPSSFVHQDTGYETMEHDGSPLDSDLSDENMNTMDSMFQPLSPTSGGFNALQFPVTQLGRPLPLSAEKFRFHSTLNAPTAMIKHADEIPVTYLNKGQAYSLSIMDTNTTMPFSPGTKYRTFVRVSFEDDEQRQKPGVCWGLWKEGRGTNEAHQRGGKLQAVEYVEAGQPVEGDEKRTRVELETSSFDGFSVVWTPGANGATDVSIAVRFNFLSTDFSHSKGVKGIPVRLCSKTSVVSSEPSSPVPDANAETCFCKVKLFRDHGAERKLSNDVAHIKKSIDKMKQQIAQAESGMKDFGKRKRSSVVSRVNEPQKPGKLQKHKRTWSMSSASSADGGRVGGRMTVKEDLHFKLQTMQDMFTSTRPVSVLYLRGEDLDDPDLHPVAMPGELSPQTKAKVQGEGPNWQARSTHTSSLTGSMISPSPSSLSITSQASAIGQANQWQNMETAATSDPIARKASEQVTKVKKTEDDGSLSGWIEALDVDQSYKPPPERTPKPVACFYILRQRTTEPERREYHRAIYLTQRSLKELNQCIAAKWGFDASSILRTLHVIHQGLEVEMDDDVVRELKEGQDMKIEVEEIVEPPPPTKREWEMTVDSKDEEAALSPQPPSAKRGLALRLTF